MGVLEERQVADENWKRDVDRRLDQHFERLEQGDERMSQIEGSIRANTSLTETVKQDTADLVVWAQNIIGFRNTVDWLAGVVIKVGAMLIAVGVLYWAIATGQLPRRAEAPHAQDTAFALLDSKRRHDTEGRVRARQRKTMPGLEWAGTARPAAPVSVFAEDFSLLIRSPRRLRTARSRIRVLS